MKKILLLAAFFLMLPLVAGAAEGINFSFFTGTLRGLGNLLNLTIPLLIGAALIVFFWGLIQYIRKPEAETGKKIMIAGLAGLFVMVSVWGIIRLMQSITNTGGETTIPAPSVPRPSSAGTGRE